MRHQFTKTLKNILHSDNSTSLLLGDIGVYGFRDEIEKLSNRVYNIGILEQSTISLAAGLSKQGIIPFIHTIAPFMVERGFEQIKIDFGYQQLNGNFISVGSSYDYTGLGCTHHCPGDVSLLLTIENMHVFIPGSSEELHSLISTQYKNNYPKYFRLSETENNVSFNIECSKANVIKTGNKATIICYGPMLQSVMDAVSDIDVTILYYTTIYPFDSKTLVDNFNENVIICEPFYQGTTNYLISNSLSQNKCSITNIGIPRKFLYNYGSKLDHDVSLGLDSQSIRKRILSCLT
jgi:transketolase